MPVPPAVERLRSLLAGLPEGGERAARAAERVADWGALVRTAEAHGVAGAVLAWLKRADITAAREAVRAAEREQRFEALRQDVAREALHGALEALDRAAVRVVPLKGPLLAARIYDEGVERPSTDIDLLIDGRDAIQPAARALEPLGYKLETGESWNFFYANHHDVHVMHPLLPFIELHFEAYRGFGTALPAGPLLDRSVQCSLPAWQGARVLTAEDEFLYLAVHAASHRFGRLGWLYDLKLYLLRHAMRWDLLEERAAAQGLTAVLCFACELLAQQLGVNIPPSLLRRLPHARTSLAEHLMAPSSTHLVNAATSFLFSATLCDDPARLTQFVGRFARIKVMHEWPVRVRSLFAGG
jgi:hypothetical protein